MGFRDVGRMAQTSRSAHVNEEGKAADRVDPPTIHDGGLSLHSPPRDFGSARNPSTTLALAKLALGQITARVLPADPPCFEVWYVYESGANLPLSRALDAILAAKGAITLADVDALYEQYLSPSRTLTRVENVGSRVAYEIDRTLATINDGAEAASGLERDLGKACRELDRSKDRLVVRSTVQQVVSLAHAFERRLRSMEKALRATKTQVTALQQDLDTIRQESLTDFLTGVGNRKHFEQRLQAVIESASRSGQPFSVVLVDIDMFKTFNDRYGHASGDQILRLVAAAIKGSVRAEDAVARFGGDEFAVVLPNTPADRAVIVAEKIRRQVTARELVNRATSEVLGRVTVSIGIAAAVHGTTREALLEAADRAMYRAKQDGRNCVRVDAGSQAAEALGVSAA